MNKAKQLELRELLAAAFADARAKGKPNWQVMYLSVLKNRLLQRTRRQFREVDYGANTMQEIVEWFPDLLAVEDGPPPSVMFLVQGPGEQPPKRGEDDTSNAPDEGNADDEVEDFQAILDDYRKSGDNLGVGEAHAKWLLQSAVDEADVERAFVNMVSSWASSDPLDVEINGVADVVRNVDRFVDDHLARAVVHATLRMRDAERKLPPKIADLNYRVAQSLQSLLPSGGRTSPTATMNAAVAKTRELQIALEISVKSFCRSTPGTAKLPSTDIIKHAHAYAPYALLGEQQTLRDVEVLLGPLFRKFCESCERFEADLIPRRAKELRYQLRRTLDSLSENLEYRLTKGLLKPVAIHISHLLEEGTRTSEEMTTPQIKVPSNTLKLDLARQENEVSFPLRIVNNGDGPARSVRIKPAAPANSPTLSILEPSDPFDLSPRADLLIRLKLSDIEGCKEVKLEVVFECETINGRSLEFKECLTFEQQCTQPDWGALLRDPPYAINPIRQKRNLYGRSSILSELDLHMSNETSVFLWGQKRIGKTSVLQVLASSMDDRPDIVCIVLRMGELISLHEGQVGHAIAVRLADALGVRQMAPAEEEFDAGLGKLVPFVEKLRSTAPRKMLVIIDEFDDLNPAFYLGERGKQFVKALRSLSEVGLTFMFVGSERMNSIYDRHAAELNKWVNSSLDRIESGVDCEALIVQPVLDKIEYDRDSVKSIVEYCQGNPFYMHLIAGKIFQRCAQERRTFVGSGDFEYVHRRFVQELGPTNFAHFWEDVPILDPDKKLRVVANNCLFLACVARLASGRYESLDDIVQAQELLGLDVSERLSRKNLKDIENGLLHRRVISRRMRDDAPRTEVELPIFRDWLLENEMELVRRRESCLEKLNAKDQIGDRGVAISVERPTFPVDLDDLLSISSRLKYLGKQKDAAEVEQWLLQFNDDSRIEVAFLLLKRLVVEGFINEGASVNGLANMVDALNARRQEIGQGAWRMARRRRDNLYVGFVDSETKSGATTARELAKRMSPSKCAGVEEMGTWLKAHLDDDPVIVVVDDFAGTGGTLVKGLEGLWSGEEKLFSQAAKEGRILCCVQTAFSEAIERIKRDFPRVNVLPMKTFGDEVRAFSPRSGIFENERDRKFAERVMDQIGRQLVRQNPLGFGNMAALVSFHNTVPNNTLPVFWCSGVVNDQEWKPLMPRGTFGS